MAAAAQKKRLGRGLASLIGADDAGADADDQRTVPLASLRASRFNPRRDFDQGHLEELANSIRERGLVQPLVVRPAKGEPDKYEIVAGERRWRAAQIANLHEIPVVIRPLSDQETLEIAIIENVQREDLNAIEEGEGYRQLMGNHGYTQDDLAKVIGKSRSHLANTLRLLKLPERVQVLVREGKLSAGHARALIGRADAEALALRIVNEGLTVREIEALTKETTAKSGTKAKRPGKDADTRAAETELAEALGLKVEIKPGKGEKGELRIRYASYDQLEDVRRKLLRHRGH
jgi:ParB family chromosome partitioning protein